jgi:hypothetical protein
MELTKYTDAGVSTYSFPALAGKVVTSFQFGQIMLAPSQFSLAGNGDVTLINTGGQFIDITFPIDANIFMRITYH